MGLSIPLTVLTSAGAQMVSAGAGRIVYISTAEMSGLNPATFELFDGAVPTNRGLLIYNLAESGSTRDSWTDHGVPFEGDLWIGNTGGTATAIVHVVPEDLWHRWKADYWRGIENYLMYGQGA